MKLMSVMTNKSTVLLTSTDRRAPKTPFFSLRRMASLTLALLLAIAGVAVWGIVGAVDRAPVQHQHAAWAACGMLVLLACVMLLLGRSVTARSLAIIERQLRAMAANNPLTMPTSPVPDDLRPVMGALTAYVEQVRCRMDELRLQKKELDIQMRVAETERQNTEAIIFSISEAVLVIDSFGELVLANTAAETLFNFDARQWRHRPLERILADTALVSLLKDARTTGENSVRRQVEYGLLKEGRTQTFNITLSTVLDSQGQSRGVVAVFHDITRERELAQIKSDFVSAVSHELRTPLSSIKAYVEMLVDGEAHDEDTRKHFYHIIETETERLQRLINNILNISKIESGVVEVRRQQVQANEVVQNVIAMMMPQAGDKRISLEFEMDEYLPTVLADTDMMHQAILNIVSNAVKYTPSGGRVQVSTATSDDGQRIKITVRDNGMGIKASDLPHVFDKFYRSRDGAAVAKGTGLGLNLVKHIVEKVHQGEIAIASEPGAGTTITLHFLCDTSALQEQSA